ncbi:uncharacterized protein [Heptranchias perlo]|uniref:uncharacterized protein n=1 Tax=Heptranchias perlo TaxID=212740 RepID=UPI00355A6934
MVGVDKQHGAYRSVFCASKLHGFSCFNSSSTPFYTCRRRRRVHTACSRPVRPPRLPLQCACAIPNRACAANTQLPSAPARFVSEKKTTAQITRHPRPGPWNPPRTRTPDTGPRTLEPDPRTPTPGTSPLEPGPGPGPPTPAPGPGPPTPAPGTSPRHRPPDPRHRPLEPAPDPAPDPDPRNQPPVPAPWNPDPRHRTPTPWNPDTGPRTPGTSPRYPDTGPWNPDTRYRPPTPGTGPLEPGPRTPGTSPRTPTPGTGPLEPRPPVPDPDPRYQPWNPPRTRIPQNQPPWYPDPGLGLQFTSGCPSAPPSPSFTQCSNP